MRKTFTYIQISLLLSVPIICKAISSEQKIDTNSTEYSDSAFINTKTLFNNSKNYLHNRDFDGDNINDYLSFNYTGGAHCCYKMILKLSSLKDTIKYPFEMDGGYCFGIVDGSRQGKFSIGDYDNDNLPEIFMRISTYNEEINPINPEWTSKYGIKSNYIIFDYNNGKLHLEDYDNKKHLIKH